MIGSFVVSLTYLVCFDEMIGNFTFSASEEKRRSHVFALTLLFCGHVLGGSWVGRGRSLTQVLIYEPRTAFLGAAVRPVSTFLWTFLH